MLEPVILAHVGHWISWVLYAVPIVAVLIAIAVSARRGRRLDAEERNDST